MKDELIDISEENAIVNERQHFHKAQDEIESLKSKVQELENIIVAYKVSELNDIYRKLKNMVYLCDKLTYNYYLPYQSRKIGFHTRVDGETVEEFVNECICIVNKLRIIVCKQVEGFNVVDNKNYDEALHKCLEVLCILLESESNLKTNMCDYTDAGCSLGLVEYAIEEFKCVTLYANKIFDYLNSMYPHKFEECHY